MIRGSAATRDPRPVVPTERSDEGPPTFPSSPGDPSARTRTGLRCYRPRAIGMTSSVTLKPPNSKLQKKGVQGGKGGEGRGVPGAWGAPLLFSLPFMPLSPSSIHTHVSPRLAIRVLASSRVGAGAAGLREPKMRFIFYCETKKRAPAGRCGEDERGGARGAETLAFFLRCAARCGGALRVSVRVRGARTNVSVCRVGPVA